MRRASFLRHRIVRDERGITLVLTMLIVLVVASLAAAAFMVGSNHFLVNRYYERQALLDGVAESGLEYARTLLNADPDLYPDEGYAVLEDGEPVTGPDGDPIPAVRRWLYAGPTGISTGQFGVFGTIVAVARDDGDAVSIRRLQIFEESFARYAYFTDVEPSNIWFGAGDQLLGPVHSNDELKIHSTGATFHDETRTAKNVRNPNFGEFLQGYEEGVARIELPETQDLMDLQEQALEGNTAFTASSGGSMGEATLRIEFVALDLNGDGTVTGENEGFIRAYRSNDVEWLLAHEPQGGVGALQDSRNCGDFNNQGEFMAAAEHPGSAGSGHTHNAIAALTASDRRCFLGGDPELFGGFQPQDAYGEWIQWPGAVHPLVQGRPDAQYLFPITRPLNPDFKGVIFVDGNVAISGTLRSRVTVAATGDIILADDVTYAHHPSGQTCTDILGLFAGGNVVVSDNTMNAPVRPGPGQNWRFYTPEPHDHYHLTVLALDVFTVENFGGGARSEIACGDQSSGRGCLYLTGGIIQRERGAVGQLHGGGQISGYIKRYDYDRCGLTDPPPYFPTTGHFMAGLLHQMDPVGFDVDDWWDMMTPN